MSAAATLPDGLRTVSKWLVLAIAYYAAGRLGLLLSVNPGYASGFWPASGLALGTLLVFGRDLWPGVWLGAFAVYAGVLQHPALDTNVSAALLPSVILATGAALQALAGTSLIRRFVGLPLELVQQRDVLRFCVLAGPATSVISATVGAATLRVTGAIPSDQLAYTWLTWWVGDSIGLGVITPLVLVWKAEPREVWRRRTVSVAVPLAVSLGIAVALFSWVGQMEQRRIRSEFDKRAQRVTLSVAASVESALKVLHSLASFVVASSDAETPAGFSQFARRTLSVNPTVQALSWNPRIRGDERLEFEQRTRAAGYVDFRIRERDAKGQLVPAPPRDEYVTVWHIEPRETNAAARGYDVASEPLRAEALRRACATGAPAATAGIRLVQDTSGGQGMLVFLPVYTHGPTARDGSCAGVRGFATGVFRINALMRAAVTAADDRDLIVEVVDTTSHDPETLWRGVPVGADAASGPRPLSVAASELSYTSPMSVGGRTWSVICTATPSYFLALGGWRPWGVLFTGMLFASFLVGFLLVVTGNAVTIERMGAERTTELKAAYDRLVESEARLTEAQKIAHVGNWEWEVGRNELWWSDELYRIFGVDRGSFQNSYAAFLGLIHPDDRSLVERAVRRAVQERQAYHMEHRIVRPDGTIRVIHGQGRVVVGEAGQVVRLIGAAQDITERKAAEEIVRRSEHRLQTIIDAEPACVTLASSDGIVLDMNRAGLTMVGAADAAPVIGRRVIEFVHPADHAKVLDMHRAASNGASARCEFRIVALDGGERWVDSHVVPFEMPADEHDADRTVLSVTSDITERKQLEEQLRQSQKMEAIGRLAGGIAHDFNNLLTVIHGVGDLVLNRIRHQPDLAADVEEIKKAAERASQLTGQLLAFSRKQLLSPRVLDLNRVVEGCEQMLRRIISEAIRLDIRAAPSLEPTTADQGQIEQLVMNLVVNACDAMPHGGTLTIATANVVLDSAFTRRHAGAVPGRYVSLTVTDTGVGMSPDVLSRVFEPFFTTKEPGKGTGLGLSTVYGVVKQSGGYITVESAPGLGTTVTTYLPAVDEPIESVSEEPKAAPTFEGTETILLVEDEPGVRSLMRRVLQAYGYVVLQAQDADEALAIEESYHGPIHVLVSDMMMPGLSGPDLAQRIVKRRPAIQVLFVSGHTGPHATGLGVRSPNVSFLQKPFRPQSLVASVRERLDHHERQAEGT